MKVKIIDDLSDGYWYSNLSNLELEVSGEAHGVYYVEHNGFIEIINKEHCTTIGKLLCDEYKDTHYKNDNGSLYKFAVDHDLNAYEFDIVKRIVRCRKKGQLKEDLEKTKRVIDLYLKEQI
jgi:hypothetical protein